MLCRGEYFVGLGFGQPSVSTAPGRGGSKPPAAAQPLNIQRTAQLRQLREAKSLPYRAWAYELRYHHLQIVYSCKSPIRPRCVRTNRDERELTNHHVSARIKLRRMYTTTHGTTSRRLYLELKTVCKSVLEPPFQAQISGTLSPYTKDCFNTR